jgi:predicted AlkP superfamily pyrophosphatase or phosphodiesterase
MSWNMKWLLSIAFVSASIATIAQPTETPKLVVGIVVDQMRFEYLYRFERKFGEGGFKRFLQQGFVVKNGHYNYVPTYTGPGHASVYSGSTPAVHGIIGNDWFDKTTQKNVNCVGDDRFKPVGSTTGNGDVSPSRMLTTTISDELEIATQRRAKVVGISIKDRGAVLPAGHTPDGAYWYDDTTGKFITSTYYKPGLPVWLEEFNAKKIPDKYLAQEWKTLLPIDQYKESGPDDTPYEGKIGGKDRPVFPYNLKELRKPNDWDLISDTPFGNDMLAELAKAAVEGEAMGKDDWTDMLCVSFSSPDHIGHTTGPNSIEVEDVYIRLDRTLADFFNMLDGTVGKNAYTVFLTADHAVADPIQYMKDLKIPADTVRTARWAPRLNEFLQTSFPGKKPVEIISNDQVFLNQDLFGADPRTSGIDYLVTTELIRSYLMQQPGVADVLTKQMIQNADYNEGGVKGMVRRGFHARRSGDLAIVLEPGWHGSITTGTTHGSPYTYDTHVPILFYGFGIRHGSTVTYHTITDIAPTMSVLMKIKFPNGSTGQPIAELLDTPR